MGKCGLKRYSRIYTDSHSILSYKILLCIKSKPTKLYTDSNASEVIKQLRLRQSIASSKVIAKVIGFKLVPIFENPFVKLRSASFFYSVASNISKFRSPEKSNFGSIGSILFFER